MNTYDIIIIGGGPAGLAAAISARKSGIESILILERDERLGGILNQCIHNGFGLHTFNEELTGPEYASRFIKQVLDMKIEYMLGTMVLDITSDRTVTAINRDKGLLQLKAGAIVLAMGCRERSRGALNIPGYRPAGIYSAGTAQRLMNIEGHKIGKEVVILGSGDIGLIMARRMTLEGAKVKVVAELMPYSGGLKRNIVQCLDDYNIPLKLSHTIINIHCKKRITGITLAEVGPDRRPIPGTEEYYSCDTLLLSVGLLPENELSTTAGVALDRVTSGPVVTDHLETNIPGIFACGNVLHVHDLVDYVSEEADHAGAFASEFVKKNREVHTQPQSICQTPLVPQGAVRYTVPQTLYIPEMSDKVIVRFRVANILKNQYVSVYYDDVRVSHKKKMIMAPGEMEQVVITRESLKNYPDLKQIRICTEEA